MTADRLDGGGGEAAEASLSRAYPHRDIGGLQSQVDDGCQVISDRVQVHRVPFEPGITGNPPA